MKDIPYVDQPCERCGSKRRVLKTWTETVLGFSVNSKVECSQIICTNKKCQKLFDEDLEKEVKKRKDLKIQKEERDRVKKLNVRSGRLTANKNIAYGSSKR